MRSLLCSAVGSFLMTPPSNGLTKEYSPCQISQKATTPRQDLDARGVAECIYSCARVSSTSIVGSADSPGTDPHEITFTLLHLCVRSLLEEFFIIYVRNALRTSEDITICRVSTTTIISRMVLLWYFCTWVVLLWYFAASTTQFCGTFKLNEALAARRRIIHYHYL